MTQSELDELIKDAERYRWPKSQKGLLLENYKQSWYREDGTRFETHYYLATSQRCLTVYETLDETIDMAMIVKKEPWDGN